MAYRYYKLILRHVVNRPHWNLMQNIELSSNNVVCKPATKALQQVANVPPFCFHARCYRVYNNTGQNKLYKHLKYSGYNNINKLYYHTPPKISPKQATKILQLNESSHQFLDANEVVKGFHSNQLEANHPIEDRRAQARCKLTPGLLFGVFDGHAGPACAQAVCQRLFEYIALEILPFQELKKTKIEMEKHKKLSLVDFYRHPNDYISQDSHDLFLESIHKYLLDNLSVDHMDDIDIQDCLEIAFDRLDKDLSSEAKKTTDSYLNEEALHIAISGACACVAYVRNSELYVANTGDCRAVLGQIQNGTWSAVALSEDHVQQNQKEVKRLKAAHPASEDISVLKNGRLLGELMPLRAFGDVRFKWTETEQRTIISELNPGHVIPKYYKTPPYLIATPDICMHTITKSDRFLILASDGLWEMISPEKCVKLVGDFLQPQKMDDIEGLSLLQIQTRLKQHKETLIPVDDNVATHLIRYALCGSGNKFKHDKLSTSLTLPKEISRSYRDDITVTVVFF
ncbi:pyruvate dehydrogenase [acetyl-transferring]-phosphatase 1, mitochondrial-like [Anneissia japonica]|uniref:pyruvate dehydrogenase [acetyl-transferring]-phosphatase 1, mitochondrial-like n=1 Tax=Anneissia japonica TaxID=1529436 RepID=UPI0014255E67|nr:pyruvate dehydrogenase [acetyl-transferring]-phosphatase 1, mitochondrial-like [Anneissia japonica]